MELERSEELIRRYGPAQTAYLHGVLRCFSSYFVHAVCAGLDIIQCRKRNTRLKMGFLREHFTDIPRRKHCRSNHFYIKSVFASRDVGACDKFIICAVLNSWLAHSPFGA